MDVWRVSTWGIKTKVAFLVDGRWREHYDLEVPMCWSREESRACQASSRGLDWVACTSDTRLYSRALQLSRNSYSPLLLGRISPRSREHGALSLSTCLLSSATYVVASTGTRASSHLPWYTEELALWSSPSLSEGVLDDAPGTSVACPYVIVQHRNVLLLTAVLGMCLRQQNDSEVTLPIFVVKVRSTKVRTATCSNLQRNELRSTVEARGGIAESSPPRLNAEVKGS